jgi:hypothetical protein
MGIDMDCAQCAARVAAFRDGDLEGDEADDVAEHLEGCPACCALLDDDPAVEPPRIAPVEWGRRWDAIQSAVLPEQHGRAGAARLVRFLIPLAASILAVLSAYGYSVVTRHVERTYHASSDDQVALFGLTEDR